MATKTSNHSSGRVLIAGAAMVAVVLTAALLWPRQEREDAPGSAKRDAAKAGASQHPAGRRGPPIAGAVPESMTLAAAAGVVRDLEGRGIGDAQVCARRPDVLVIGGLGARCVTSDADGRFRVDSLAPGAYSIFAGAPEKIE